MFLFICGREEGVSQMLPQRRPCAEARTCLHVGMYPLLACALRLYLKLHLIDTPFNLIFQRRYKGNCYTYYMYIVKIRFFF